MTLEQTITSLRHTLAGAQGANKTLKKKLDIISNDYEDMKAKYSSLYNENLNKDENIRLLEIEKGILENKVKYLSRPWYEKLFDKLF